MGPLVFKTSERRAASLAGSIPVRLRHQHVCADQVIRRTETGYPRPAVPRMSWRRSTGVQQGDRVAALAELARIENTLTQMAGWSKSCTRSTEAGAHSRQSGGLAWPGVRAYRGPGLGGVVLLVDSLLLQHRGER